MDTQDVDRVWKIRTIKNYPEAHNHILVGKVLDVTESYVRLHCRTYHFGPNAASPQEIQTGGLMVRVVPWSRIEIINELPDTFDYVRSVIAADKPGEVLFKDNQHAYPVGTSRSCDVKY